MNRESLINTLEVATGNATDVYYGLYTDYFENGDEPQEALKIILEYPDEIGDIADKNPTQIARQEEGRLVSVFEGIISGIANRIAEKNPAKEDFYKKLYETIFASDSDVLPQSKEEKVVALKILSESVNVVPYYQILETEKVSKEEFEKGIEKLRPKLQEAFHMTSRQFATTPEETAQILRVADSLTDKKDQIIFWTVIINMLRKDREND